MRSSHSHQHPLSRSLEKYFEKENQYPTYNFHTNKDKLRNNASHLPLSLAKKTSEGYLAQPTIKPKGNYNINELENISMIQTYCKNFLNQNKMLPHCGFLSRHEVTCLFRAKMVDWMVEVMTSYKCTDRTLFKAIEVMDQYYMKTQSVEKARDLHLVGVTCILIANKMEEVYPLKIRILHEKIAHKKLSITQIAEKQAQIFQILDYNLNVQSLGDCVEIVLSCFCIENQHFQKLEKISTYITKMVSYQYSIISTYSKQVISCTIVILSLKLLEGMMSRFQGKGIMNSVMRIMKHHKNSIYECEESIQKLLRNFDHVYPNLPNFKKFNKVIVEGKNIKSYL